MVLKVLDSSLSFEGAIDNFSSCIITRKYRGIETLELVAPVETYDLLNTHGWIDAGSKRIFEILHKEVEQGNPRTLRMTAYGGGKTLAKRITIPPALSAYDTATGSYDAVVKQYINNNIVDPADGSRGISFISFATAKAGTGITDQTRYKNLYDEVVRVLSVPDAGFFFQLIDGSIVFDTYEGANRTSSNGVNPPAIFSIEYDNLISSKYMKSLADCVNTVYVGGQGEGVDRTIVRVKNELSYQRFESFSDGRDTNDTTELEARGYADMSPEVESFEAQISPYSNLTYGTDYDLGDMVTIQDKTLGVALDSRITEVQEVYQQGSADTFSLTFGNTLPTIISPINSQRKKIAGLLTI